MSWPLALVLCTAIISVTVLMSTWINSNGCSCHRSSSAPDEEITDSY